MCCPLCRSYFLLCGTSAIIISSAVTFVTVDMTRVDCGHGGEYQICWGWLLHNFASKHTADFFSPLVALLFVLLPLDLYILCSMFSIPSFHTVNRTFYRGVCILVPFFKCPQCKHYSIFLSAVFWYGTYLEQNLMMVIYSNFKRSYFLYSRLCVTTLKEICGEKIA